MQSGAGYFGEFSVLSPVDLGGDMAGAHRDFTRPVPITSVKVDCFNESEDCCLAISILGTQN